MGEKMRTGEEEALRGNNGSRIGWEARTGTEANLMRCDKEWKGMGEVAARGRRGFTSIGCARSWAKGSIGGSLPFVAV